MSLFDMTQYFVPCIVNLDRGCTSIVAWMEPSDYLNGNLIEEHGLIGSNFVEAFEGLLIPNGYYHMANVIWSSEKAITDDECETNLYNMCHNGSLKVNPDTPDDLHLYPYLVNHSKRMYVDKRDSVDLHPLPLLTAESKGVGFEDIIGVGVDLVGTWSKDLISVEKLPPTGYDKLDCCFEP